MAGKDGVLFDVASDSDGLEEKFVASEEVLPADYSSIRQSKVMTFASYGLSKIHTNMLVHIREELQGFLLKHVDQVPEETLIQVPLFVKDYPHFKGNVVALYESAKTLLKENNHVEFSWTYSERLSPLLRWMFGLDNVRGRQREKLVNGAVVHQASALIVNVRYVEGTSDYVMLQLNPACIPFLLYDGKLIGSTMFNRDVALGFKSAYSNRIYEFLMDWSTKSAVKVLPLSEIRFRLKLDKSYESNANLRMRILEVARREINASASSVNFDFELYYDPQFGDDGGRTKKKANAVRFVMTRKDVKTDLSELRRKMVKLLLEDVADKEKSVYCDRLSYQIVENGTAEVLIAKFTYYDGRMKKGKIQRKEYVNTMLKIVREVTGFDLRSDSHIRNSKIYSRRTNTSFNEPRLLFDGADGQ